MLVGAALAREDSLSFARLFRACLHRSNLATKMWARPVNIDFQNTYRVRHRERADDDIYALAEYNTGGGIVIIGPSSCCRDRYTLVFALDNK